MPSRSKNDEEKGPASPPLAPEAADSQDGGFQREPVFVPDEHFFGDDDEDFVEVAIPDDDEPDPIVEDSTPVDIGAGEHRYLDAQAPANANRGTRFSVTAAVLCSAPSRPHASLGLISVPDEGLQLTLILGLDDAFNAISATSAVLNLQRGRDSESIRFDVEVDPQADVALRSADVHVRAFTNGIYLGEVSLAVVIGPAANEDNPRERDGIELQMRSPPEEAATLEVTFNRRANRYTFNLLSSGSDPVETFELDIDENLDELIRELNSKLDMLARGDVRYTGGDPEIEEAYLVGIGSDLWDRLLPRELKTVLLDNANRIRRLTVIAVNDPLPWELLYAVGDEAESNGFLADRWLITRWGYGPSAPLTVARGTPRYVLPSNAPAKAAFEVSEIRKLYPSNSTWSKVTDLLAGIRELDIGLLHVAAHNNVVYDGPASSYIVLDLRFEQSLLGPTYRNKLRGSSPLVFLNACSSAATTQQWVGATSWASRFLDAGAGAFLGTLWQVRDTTASRFALTFYRATKEAKTLGEAFKAARAAIDSKGDPSRFAYTLYGDPDARLN